MSEKWQEKEDDEDDEPQLSSHALAALNSFLAEKQQKEEQLQRLAEADNSDPLLDEIDLEEDWVTILARELKWYPYDLQENDSTWEMSFSPYVFYSFNERIMIKCEDERLSCFNI